ncbi:LysR substrate-binding domain-containing protein [Pseudooceanicola sp. LIPI14-2-Ac024]|uniref:hydrogen peroxide-inducible genes activator n=1 Tax=Pseudooceanicola sp. LIPI14-2-Ac024 TaxID=3344875 RepID=UPI0035D10799
MAVTLRQLAYFKALAEQQNFGRAADVVHVSQPALSAQIRELEASLGAPLIERQPRRAVLTPFGRRMLTHAEAVLSQVAQMEEDARWREGLAGQLSLGIIPTLAPYILPGALAALRARDLSLDVQVSEGKTARLLSDLASGRLDAALMALPVEGEGLVSVPLFEDRFLLAGTEARLASLGTRAEPMRPTEIAPGQLLLLEDGHCLTDQALEVCGRGRGNAQINMGASSLATLSRLVAAGFGLTLLPEIALAAEMAAAPGMAVTRFSAPEPARQIGLVRRATSRDDGWFSALAAILGEVGDLIVGQARDAVPPAR